MIVFRAGLLAGLVVVLPLSPARWAQAAELSIAGEYHCRSGCRLTDAAPSVEIAGTVAQCMNELGGTFSGKVLSPTMIACFNKTGTLSKDGKTIEWSDGVVWAR